MTQPLKLNARFWRYLDKVYDLSRWLARIPDSRSKPRFPAGRLLLQILVGLWTRSGSLLQMERMGRNGELGSLWEAGRAPSNDTLARCLASCSPAVLREPIYHSVRTARRNKVWPRGTLEGWMVATVDGSEVYATQHRRKNMAGWAVRRVRRGKAWVEEYVERVVAVSYVGAGPRLGLEVERIRPGEGEAEAAARAVERLDAALGPTWCDVLVMDAGYASGPFLRRVLRGQRHVVVKVKQENRVIVQDAEGLARGRAPDVQRQDVKVHEEAQDRYDVAIWDEENFTTWPQVGRPLRCLKVVEVRKERRGGGWVAQEPQTYYVVTTIPKALKGPMALWRIMHRRWDIENSLFNDLTQNWAFTHCYTRSVAALEALYLLVWMARNLLLLFVHRNLRGSTRARWTYKEWGRLLGLGLSWPDWWRRVGWVPWEVGWGGMRGG